jgi:hypothetical protein
MNPGYHFLRRGVAAFVILLILFGCSWLFRAMVPAIWQTFAVPGAVLVLAIAFTPARVAAGIRLSLVGVVWIVFLATNHFQPGGYWRTGIIVLALLWGAGQLFLVVASERVRVDRAGPFLRSLHESGFSTTLRRMDRGVFGDSLARGTRACRWAAALLVVTLLLSRAGALDADEEQLILSPWLAPRLSGPSHSLVVTLTTTDNNAQGYLRTALELNSIFRKAGAVVSVFPRFGPGDSIARHLLDSLTAMGGVTFDPPRFGWFTLDRPQGSAFTRFIATDISWRDGKPVVHPAIVAAARFFKAPLRLPGEFLKAPSFASGSGNMPRARNAEIMIGEHRIPIWSDGYSAVRNPHSLARVEQWNSFLFRASIERTSWDSALTYREFEAGKHVPALADSLCALMKGRMVFVQWENLSEDFRSDFDVSEPARIADMIVRGLIVDRAGPWHIALTCLVLLAGCVLSVRTRIGIQVAALLTCAAAFLILDGWIFREWLLLTSLVYPAFAAFVAAIILPLVRLSEEGA